MTEPMRWVFLETSLEMLPHLDPVSQRSDFVAI